MGDARATCVLVRESSGGHFLKKVSDLRGPLLLTFAPSGLAHVREIRYERSFCLGIQSFGAKAPGTPHEFTGAGVSATLRSTAVHRAAQHKQGLPGVVQTLEELGTSDYSPGSDTSWATAAPTEVSQKLLSEAIQLVATYQI